MILLIKDVSFVDVFHDVSSNDCMKVSFHEIKYQIDVFIILGFEDVKEGHDVRMTIELLQENDLTNKRTTSR